MTSYKNSVPEQRSARAIRTGTGENAHIHVIEDLFTALCHLWRQPLSSVGVILENLKDDFERGELNHHSIEQGLQQAVSKISVMSQVLDRLRHVFMPGAASERFAIQPVVTQCVRRLESALPLQVKMMWPPNAAADCMVQGSEDVFKDVLACLIQFLHARRRDVPAAKGQNVRVVLQAAQDRQCYRLDIFDFQGPMPQAELDGLCVPSLDAAAGSPGTGVKLFLAKISLEKNLRGSMVVQNKGQGICFCLHFYKDGVHDPNE